MFESSRAHHQSQNPVKSGYLAGFFRVTASTGIAHELGVEATHDREASIDWSRIYLIPVVLFGWQERRPQVIEATDARGKRRQATWTYPAE